MLNFRKLQNSYKINNIYQKKFPSLQFTSFSQKFLEKKQKYIKMSLNKKKKFKNQEAELAYLVENE